MPPPSGKRGRQRRFSDAATQSYLTLKVLFGLPLRQTYRVRRKPATDGRTGLGDAGFQHLMPSPTNIEREPALSWQHRQQVGR